MKLRICSDLHLEFADYEVPALEGDKETVLVLAGDIGLVHKKSNMTERYIPFLARASAQFRKVVMIVGNHEHYHGSFKKTHALLRAAIEAAGLQNVALLEKSSCVVDDVAFIGSTLWTECDNQSPYANMLFRGMNDSRLIRTGINDPYERAFSATASWVDFSKAVMYTMDELAKQRADGKKTVVVTHHAPSHLSIHHLYVGSPMNMFYASDLSKYIREAKPNLWIHGHTHHQFDYALYDTRVVANPRGYHGHEDTSGFNETLVIEV